MFESNSLSAMYHLRDLERRFAEPELRPYRRKPVGVRGSQSWSANGVHGLLAYAIVMLAVGGAFWL